jgi:histidine triad (HIT) family protein
MATIFTKIIRGDIPSYKIAENENFFSFLDINPIAEGHTLVVPKKEVDYFFDQSPQEIHRMMDFSQTIAAAIDKTLQPLRTGIIVQGLEVPHAHLHLIPLYSQTQPMALGHNVEVNEDRMKDIEKQLNNAVQL